MLVPDINGVKATLSNGRITLSKNGEELITGTLGDNNMYKLDISPVPNANQIDEDLAIALNTLVIDKTKTDLPNFITAFLVT